jgi:hypothetical protein
MQNGLYYLADSRNQLRFDPYQRLDWRINKSWTKDKYKMTLYVEIINLTNQTNYRFDSFNGYNSTTGQASVARDKLFRSCPPQDSCSRDRQDAPPRLLQDRPPDRAFSAVPIHVPAPVVLLNIGLCRRFDPPLEILYCFMYDILYEKCSDYC